MKPPAERKLALPARPDPEQQSRLDREAAALRQNLLRRKQQARQRQAGKPDAPQR